MKLTTEMAKQHKGQYIDCEKRLFHNYPLKIIDINGRLFLKDAVGVCFPIEDKGFNVVHFDFFVQE